MGDQKTLPEIKSFVGRVRKNPMKYTEVLLSVSERHTNQPYINIVGKLAKWDLKAYKALVKSADSTSQLQGLHHSLVGILIDAKHNNQKFREVYDEQEKLLQDLNSTLKRTEDWGWRRWCKWKGPKLRTSKPTKGMTDVIGAVPTPKGKVGMRFSSLEKLGKSLITSNDFRGSFQGLYRRIKDSPMKSIIYSILGLELINAPRCRNRRGSSLPFEHIRKPRFANELRMNQLSQFRERIGNTGIGARSRPSSESLNPFGRFREGLSRPSTLARSQASFRSTNPLSQFRESVTRPSTLAQSQADFRSTNLLSQFRESVTRPSTLARSRPGFGSTNPLSQFRESVTRPGTLARSRPRVRSTIPLVS